jgi:GAF domain-containing protein
LDDSSPEIVSTRDDSVINAKRRDADTKQIQIDARGRRSNDRSRPVINKIVSSESMGKILFSLTKELKDLFECQAVTVFAVDREKRQIFSRNFQDNEVDEIRLEISSKSLAGFVAATGKTLNIENAYDVDELRKIHSDLELDKSWDEKFEFKTQSALVVALPYNKRLMGVIECINHASGNSFSNEHIRQAKDLSSTLGHALVKPECVNDFETLNVIN